MFVNGFHRVSEVRERTATAPQSSGIEVWLDARSVGSSVVIVTFTDRDDHDVQLIRSRPTPLVRFSRPRAEAAEFLSTFPIGTLVSSSLVQPSGKPATFVIAKYADASLSHRTLDLTEIVATASPDKKSLPIHAAGLDPDIIGTWETGGRRYDIRADGSYLVRDVREHELRDGGTTLYWAPMIFSRLSGDSNNVAGHWLSADGDEDVLLRNDGTYVWHTAGSLPDALGEWLVNGDELINWELRAHVSTDGNSVYMDAVFSGTYSGTFELNADKTEMTLTFAGLAVVYSRV